MKKSPFIPLMLLLFAACQTEPVDPTDKPLPEGVYIPQRHISHITSEDAMEIWDWNGNLLQTLSDANTCGGYNEKCWFYYNDRQQLVTMQSSLVDIPYKANYIYSGDKLQSVLAYSDGLEVLGLGFTHNADGMISNISLDVNPDIAKSITSLLTGMADNDLLNAVQIQSIDASLSLSWQDSNITQQVLTSTLQTSISMGLIKEVVNLEDYLGDFAPLASLIPDSTMLPLEIVVSDTADYTYDSNPNPFRGWLYTPDVSILCRNNIVTSVNHGMATLTLSFQTPFGTTPFTLPYPLPDRQIVNSYIYDEQGYPTEVWQGEDNIRTYSYLD